MPVKKKFRVKFYLIVRPRNGLRLRIKLEIDTLELQVKACEAKTHAHLYFNLPFDGHNDKHIYDPGQVLNPVASFNFPSKVSVKAESTHSGAHISSLQEII